MPISHNILAAVSLLASCVPAWAVKIQFDNLPEVQFGNGRTVATYSNIATVDGEGVDLTAELVSEAPAAAKLFSSENGALTFAFTGGGAGQTQVATVRYSFYKQGTSEMISLDDVQILVDGLADGNGNVCSMFTADAVSYTVEENTRLLVESTASGLEVLGLQSENPTTPATSNRIQIDFGTCQELTISYGCDFQSTSPAQFSISGSKSGSFFAPLTTPLVDISGPQSIYYTYDFQNSAPVQIPVDFADELPDGLLWDPTYVPFFLGELVGDVSYLNGNRNATISCLKLPPGSSKMTLRTLPAMLSGEILNNASLTFKDGSILVAANGGTRITLSNPEELPFTATFAKSRVAGYSVLALGNQFAMDGKSTTISGDVGIGEGVLQVVGNGVLAGDYFVHPPASGSTGLAVNSTGGPLQPMLRDFASLKEEALSLSNQAAELTPTQTISGAVAGMTISATATDGVNVILFESEIRLSAQSKLVLSGSAGDYFILNIKSNAEFIGFGSIVLEGGVTASHVLVNLLPGATILKVSGKASIAGAILGVHPGNRVEIAGGSAIPVSIAGHDVTVSGNGTIAPYHFK
jgi:choice-of-anchor A domain-containing protein